MYGSDDADEQITADGDFGQLECGGTSMANNSRSSLYKPGLQAGTLSAEEG
jgi:hypothetical protein